MGNIWSTGNIYVPQEVFLAEIFARTLSTRGDRGAGVPEWIPVGVNDFCRIRRRTRSQNFE